MSPESNRLEMFLLRCRNRILLVDSINTELWLLVGLLFLLNVGEVFLSSDNKGEIKNYLGMLLPGLALIMGVPMAWLKSPSLSTLARKVDHLCHLDQRLETAWEVRGQQGEVVKYLYKDTLVRLGKCAPQLIFPFSLKKSWLFLPPLLAIYFVLHFYSPIFILPASTNMAVVPANFLREGVRWQRLTARNIDAAEIAEDKAFANLMKLTDSLSKKFLQTGGTLRELLQELNRIREEISLMKTDHSSIDGNFPEEKDEVRSNLDRQLEDLSQAIDESKRALNSGPSVSGEAKKVKNMSPEQTNKDMLNQESPGVSDSAQRRGPGAAAGWNSGEKRGVYQPAPPGNPEEKEIKSGVVGEKIPEPLVMEGIPDAIAGQTGVSGEIKRDESGRSEGSVGFEPFNDREMGWAGVISGEKIDQLEQVEARRALEQGLPLNDVPLYLRTYVRNYFLALSGVKNTNK